MEDFDYCKDGLITLGTELSELFAGARSLAGKNSGPFAAWMDNVDILTRQMSEGVLRVAVVGAIKSGKSTLVNAFFGGDYLKRGAGVVTSIVTRIAPGPELSALLTLKSWHELNDELARALALFPEPPLPQEAGPVDLRRDSDREGLRRALAALGRERILGREGRDPNYALITCLLNGFEKMKDLASTGEKTITLAGGEFPGHRDFVGDENLAVYLKDVLLTLPPREGFPRQVELADCQGSDSPNPLHLAMIEDYLVRTHLIVYAIGSRMGLRGADVRFLSLIRDMGLSDNMIFVVNVDVSEHEDVAGLGRLVDRAREEIALVVPGPETFAFSALLDLFGKNREALAEADRERLALWEARRDMAAFLTEQSKQFDAALASRLTNDRLKLLLKSPAERMRIMAAGALDWARVNRAMMREDSDKASEAFSLIEKERRNMEKVRALIRDTLAGALISGKKELGYEVDRFFDPARGGPLGSARAHLENLAPSPAPSGEQSTSAAVYAAYAELRSSMDRYLADTLNPAIVSFVLAREKDIQDLFAKIEIPFSTMAQDAVDRYNDVLRSLSVANNLPGPAPSSGVSVSAVKQKSKLSLPSLSATVTQGPMVRTEALAREGALRLASSIKKFLKIRPDPVSARERALARAVSRIKEQSWGAISENIMDFRENLKHQYLFKLMDLGAREIMESLDDRFRAFLSGTDADRDLSALHGSTREELSAKLAAVETRAAGLMGRIAGLCESCCRGTEAGG